MTNRITLTHEVSDEFVRDVMTNIIESGSTSYWGSYRRLRRDDQSEVVSFEIAEDESVDDSDDPSDIEWHLFERKDVVRGINAALADGHLADYIRGYLVRGVIEDDAGEIDGEACDVIVQIAVLGEIVYG